MSSRSERSTGGTPEWARSIVVGLSMALALATASVAQERPTATPAATAAEQPAAAKAEEQPKGGMGEGIKVHGHWTIEVWNSDGSRASRREFENALEPGGNGFLGRLLARQYTVQDWVVYLSGSPSPCPSRSEGDDCIVAEPASTHGGSHTLTVNFAPKPGSPTGGPGDLELAGNVTVGQDSDINHVRTVVWSPAGPSAFTAATLSPIPVKAGQIIQVKVVISFS